MLTKEWEKRQLRDKMQEEQKEMLNKTRCLTRQDVKEKSLKVQGRNGNKDQGSCEEY